MNGKKAKLIRKLAAEMGHYKKEADYRVKEIKKMVYGVDKNGKPMAQEVKRHTIINASRINYRKLKQAYKNGEFTI